jgi:tRNA(Ile2) C34 agmatinyltransferase TiaS
MPYFRCPACAVTIHSAAAHSSLRACPNCSTRLPDDSRVALTEEPARGIHRYLPPLARHGAEADGGRVWWRW